MLRAFGRNVTTLALLAASCLATAQLEGVPDRHVSLTYPPMRLETLLVKLSGIVGKRLMCTMLVRDDVITLAVKDVSLQELLNRLSFLTNTEWRVNKDSLSLERTAELEETERVLDMATPLRNLKSLDYNAKRGGGASFDEGTARKWGEQMARLRREYFAIGAGMDDETTRYRRKLDGQMSSLLFSGQEERLHHQILRLLDRETIAAIPDGETLVFSSRPNRMQRQLPGPANALFEQYQAENARLLREISALPIQPGYESDPMIRLQKEAVRAVPKGSALLLVVSSNGHLGFSFRLIVAAPTGETLASDLVQLSGGVSRSGPGMLTNRELALKVPMTAELDFAIKVTRAGYQGESLDPSYRSALNSYLEDPLTNEWLRLSSMAGLPAIAAPLKANVLALIPDGVIISPFNERAPYALQLPATPTIAALLEPLTFSCNVSHTSNWLTIKPSQMGKTRARRASRTLLARYGKILIQGRTPTIQERISLASSAPDARNVDRFAVTLARFMVESRLVEYGGSLSSFSLYAKFTPVQRQALEGQGCPISSLTLDQRRELERIIFVDSTTRQAPINRLVGGNPSPSMMEPTFALGGELPSDGLLILAVEQKVAVYPASKSLEGSNSKQFPNYVLTPLDADWLADLELSASAKGVESWTKREFHLGTTYNAIAKLSWGALSRTISMGHHNVVDFRRTVRFADLPQTYRDKFTAGLERRKKASG